jgi:hypothetical protein
MRLTRESGLNVPERSGLADALLAHERQAGYSPSIASNERIAGIETRELKTETSKPGEGRRLGA